MKKLMMPMALIAGLAGGLMNAPQVGVNEKVAVQSKAYRVEQKRRKKKADSHGLSPVGGCDKKSIAARRRRQGYDAYSQGEFIKKADVKRMRVALSRFNNWRYGMIWQYETHATRLAVGWR